MRAILSAAIALIASTSLAQQAPDGAQPKAGDSPAFVNGAVPGGEPDGQTVPAKYSERNAKIDDMPIMAYPLALTQEQRQELQRRLTALGFDTLGVDGLMGPRTVGAIRNWQIARGEVPDGYATPSLLERLR